MQHRLDVASDHMQVCPALAGVRWPWTLCHLRVVLESNSVMT